MTSTASSDSSTGREDWVGQAIKDILPYILEQLMKIVYRSSRSSTRPL